jgi:hypothetical protein
MSTGPAGRACRPAGRIPAPRRPGWHARPAPPRSGLSPPPCPSSRPERPRTSPAPPAPTSCRRRRTPRTASSPCAPRGCRATAPRLRLRRTRSTDGNSRRTSSAVPSREPLSTTVSSIRSGKAVSLPRVRRSSSAAADGRPGPAAGAAAVPPARVARPRASSSSSPSMPCSRRYPPAPRNVSRRATIAQPRNPSTRGHDVVQGILGALRPYERAGRGAPVAAQPDDDDDPRSVRQRGQLAERAAQFPARSRVAMTTVTSGACGMGSIASQATSSVTFVQPGARLSNCS